MTLEKRLKCLVVGCGRSGTGLVANIISENIMPCGHERIFTPWTKNSENFNNFYFESSWMAAPFIDEIEGLTHIIHVVRDPHLVINSFKKLGCFATTPIRHVTKGHDLKFIKSSLVSPSSSFFRIKYVCAMRSFLRTHTNSFNYKDETKRIECYWRSWNTMIERRAKNTCAKYRIFPLDEITENPDLLIDFLEYKKFGSISKLPIVNKKESYKSAYGQSDFFLEEKTLKLANRYELDF